MPVKIVCQPVTVTAESFRELCLDANRSSNCIGYYHLDAHIFSLLRMWIVAFPALQKPLAHLHTQFNRDLPWSTIDMDFMNLNQSAHGDREFGFIGSRLRINRKVIVWILAGSGSSGPTRHMDASRVAWHDARSSKSLALATTCGRSRDRRRQGGGEDPAGLFGPWLWGGDLVERVQAVSDHDVDRMSPKHQRDIFCRDRCGRKAISVSRSATPHESKLACGIP